VATNAEKVLRGGSNSFYLPPNAKTNELSKRVEAIQKNYETQHGVKVGVGKILVWGLEALFEKMSKQKKG